MSTLSASQLPLAPLGAGDLIDRAVRLYRRHLFVLIRTAAPPVIIATGGWLVFTLAFRRVFLTDDGAELALYAVGAGGGEFGPGGGEHIRMLVPRLAVPARAGR